MAIDYSLTEKIIELSFAKLNTGAGKIEFPKPGALSKQFSALISSPAPVHSLPHQNLHMLASAGVEMWQRAIHSFLWSVALTESSPLWASVIGYYSSHFVMRAFAHSMGIFKSFTNRTALQVVAQDGQFVCKDLSGKAGEHAFYWKAVKEHPKLISNPLFRENNERENNKNEDKSDALHRNFANYTDHIDSFRVINFSTVADVASRVEKIGRIRLHSVTAPTPQRDDFPDIDSVQILAFQRIVAFHDFLEERVPRNRFWKVHRRPDWCRNLMVFEVENQGPEQPSIR